MGARPGSSPLQGTWRREGAFRRLALFFCRRRIVEGEQVAWGGKHFMHPSKKSTRGTCTQPRVRPPLLAESKVMTLETMFASRGAGVINAGIACNNGRRRRGVSEG